MLRLDDPTSLSRLFHLNSEPWLNDEAYRGGTAHPDFTRPAGVLAETPLPAPPESALAALARRRTSCRAYAARPMPAAELSAVLAAAYGLVDEGVAAGGARTLRRTVPSAGALYPLELYALVRRVEGVPDGVHHYDVLGHQLQLLTPGDPWPAVEPALYAYPFVRDANLILLLATVFARTQTKYGPRGYRYILLEAGHAGQNVCLRAAELGLATLCMGGFVDSHVERLLGLTAGRDGVVYALAVGYAA